MGILGRRGIRVVGAMLAIAISGAGCSSQAPAAPSSSPTESVAAAPATAAAHPAVSAETPAVLCVARARRSANAWKVGRQHRLRVIGVATEVDKQSWAVRVTFDDASARRFARVSRTVGRRHGTLTVLTTDGEVLRRLRAPQPLMFSSLQLAKLDRRSAATRLADAVASSRG